MSQEWLLEQCVSVAAEEPTTNWPTWHCQEACSRTALLRPETLDRRRLTFWTAKSANGSIRLKIIASRRFLSNNLCLLLYRKWGATHVAFWVATGVNLRRILRWDTAYCEHWLVPVFRSYDPCVLAVSGVLLELIGLFVWLGRVWFHWCW